MKNRRLVMSISIFSSIDWIDEGLSKKRKMDDANRCKGGNCQVERLFI
jgi:hypothetical protein